MTAAERTFRMRQNVARLEELAALPTMTRAEEAEGIALVAESRGLAREVEADHVREAGRSGLTEREVLDAQSGRPTRRTGPRPDGERGQALDMLSTIERTHGNRSRLDVFAGIVEGVGADENLDPSEVARYVRAAGDPAYLSGFLKAHRSVVTSGSPAMAALTMTDAERTAWGRAEEYQRAVGLSGTGSLLVPFQLDPVVSLTNAGTSGAAAIRAAATVRFATSNVFRALSSAGVVAGYVPEAGELTDASPVIANKDITVHKGAAFVPISYEAAQDAGDIESTLADMLLDGKDRAEATAFTVGTGTGQPWGMASRLVTDAKTINTAGVVVGYQGVAVGDLYATKQAVPARWRARGSWIVSDMVVDGIRRISETIANGATGWLVEGLAAGNPSYLLGRPLIESTELSPGDGANGQSVAVFGDVRQYLIADRLGATLEVSASSLTGAAGRPTLQRGYTLFWRNGADWTSSDAARVLRS